MLLPKKISDTARQKASRKALEKLLKEFRADTSFKLPKNITTLFIDTKRIIDQFSVVDLWQSDTAAQLDKTITCAINSDLDAIDKALHAHITQHQSASSKHGPMLMLPFERAHGMSGNVWHHGSAYELAVKGAPEHVLTMCDLTENEREAAERKLHQLAAEGSRVLAFAHISLSHEISSFHDLTKQNKLIFDGFVSLAPHVSPRIKQVIKAAQNTDIAVYLITGDHAESALHIAKELGIATLRSHMFDSRSMHVMTTEELESKIKATRVFYRVTHENRARIIAQFKKSETLYLA